MEIYNPDLEALVAEANSNLAKDAVAYAQQTVDDLTEMRCVAFIRGQRTTKETLLTTVQCMLADAYNNEKAAKSFNEFTHSLYQGKVEAFEQVIKLLEK